MAQKLKYNVDQVDEGIERSLGIGWGNYADTLYTVGSPLVIANTKTQITCNSLGSDTNTDYLPESVTTFWDAVNNKIVAENVGDGFDTRISFKAKSSAKDSLFDVTFEIGDPSGIIIAGQTLICPKTALLETRYVLDIPIYALATFIANGCKIFIDTTIDGTTLSVYDIGVYVKRDYTQEI